MKFLLALFVVVALAGCASAPKPKVAACCRGAAASALDEYAHDSIYELNSSWQTDGGRRVKLSDLRGQPVVISMYYAACAGICLVTRDDMKAMEASLPAVVRARVRFVLVSLDPPHDTARVLQAYRSQEALPEDRWWLLRGDKFSTAQLAKLLGISFGRDASGRFVHSSEIVVLDESGKIIHRQDGIHADLAVAEKVLEAASARLGP